MGEKEFISKCKKLVAEFVLNEVDRVENMYPFQIYVVWQVKVLQNNKALLSTDIKDGMYYEITYNGDKDEFYFDAYRKVKNECISNKPTIVFRDEKYNVN